MRTLLAALALSVVLAVNPHAAGADGAGGVAALERALREAERALAENEPQIAESRYRTALLEGWMLLGAVEASEGRLLEARTAFESAAGSAVDAGRPTTSIARVLLQLGEPQEAALLLRPMLSADPANFLARRLMARALVATGRPEQATQELQELRRIDPDNLENVYVLATAYLSRGQVETAGTLLDELAAKRPLPQTHVLACRTYRDFNHFERARRACRTALEMDPRVSRAHYYLGTIDLREQGLGLLDPAMAHFEAELRIAPEDAMSNFFLGVGLVERRRYDEALPRLELAARPGGPRARALQFIGRSRLALDRPAEAAAALTLSLELIEQRLEREPELASADATQSRLSNLHYQLGQARRRLGEEAAASVHFETAKRYSTGAVASSREELERFLSDEQAAAPEVTALEFSSATPDSANTVELRKALAESLARAYLNLGVLQMRSERFGSAVELFERAEGLDPDFPRLRYSLGVARFNAGRFAQAVEPLAAALGETPGDAALRRMLALAHLSSKSYEPAARLLANDAGRDTDPSLQYAYAVALVRSGRAAEAEAVFAELLKKNSDWPALHVVLGQAHAQQGDYDAAIESLERAIGLDPAVAESHATLGDIYLRRGELERAEDALRTELSHHPDDVRARYTLAVVLDLDRRSEEAAGLLRSLLEREPRHADGRYLLGKILLADGAADEARAQLEAAAGLSPTDANIRYQLGQAYRRLGRAEEAEREFETFRRLKQDRREDQGS